MERRDPMKVTQFLILPILAHLTKSSHETLDREMMLEEKGPSFTYYQFWGVLGLLDGWKTIEQMLKFQLNLFKAS